MIRETESDKAFKVTSISRERQTIHITKRGKKPMNEEVMIGMEEEFVDETLVCKDCGNEFVFTAGEQRFYKEKGFMNKPKSCKACRDAKKNAGRAPREYFTTVCAKCGGEAKVIFQPSNDRPVYCSACFEEMKNAQ